MKYILAFILFVISSLASATSYYISLSGNDLANGLSESSPWKTISKVNSIFSTLKPGDQILFKRGDTFYGTIKITKSGIAGSPIIIGAYGTGANPVITGFTTITGWTNEGNGRYSKVITSEAQTNMVTINGANTGMGRWPDATYNIFESFVTNVSITDNGLGDATDWAGAEVVIRKNGWTLDRCKITDHTGDKLTYTNLGSTQSASANFGYFIQNDLRCLTATNEWYHNNATGKLYIYGDPAAKTVKVATLNYLIYNSSYDYITIDGLNLQGAILFGIRNVSGTNYFNIQACNISFIGESGIRTDACTNNIYDGNNISYCNRAGIYLSTMTASSVINNTISNNGLLAGGSYGGTQNDGIYSFGGTILIQYNNIANSGSCGIYFTGNNTVIRNNFISGSCLLLDDGGGIYTSGAGNTGRKIDGNIIVNSIGNNSGTPYSYVLADGIFLDEFAANIEVINNTVANCSEAGIKLHKAHDNKISNNTSFNNTAGIYFLNSAGTTIRNIVMEGNIFFAKVITQLTLNFRSVANDISSFGTSNNNVYARPIEDISTFKIYQPSTGYKYMTLSGWQSFTSQDANSKKSPITLTNTNDIRFEYNASKTNKVITLDKPMIDVKGTKYVNSITLLPYTSVVLMVDPNPVSTVLNVSPTSISLAYGSGSIGTFSITSNTSWSISDNGTWLDISPVSGTNNGTITLTANAANTGTSSRSATVTIAGSGVASKTVTVTQEPQPAGGSTLGNSTVYTTVNITNYRKAMPVTFSEDGTIQSLSIYHNGGSGHILMGVYSDASGAPSTLLGVTASTVINTTEGWQTVSLLSPASVTSGQTVWLTWVFETQVGTRYTSGTPGRAQSSAFWAGGMPSTFGTASLANYKYSLYCNYTPGSSEKTLGDANVYTTVNITYYRKATPVTFYEAGNIQSLSIYHNGGTGRVLMGVYSDASGSPSTLLGVTASTVVRASEGWQAVSLLSPVSVTSGQTVWLSWVFETLVGTRYTSGTPARAQSTAIWAGGMPATFGTVTLGNYKYSIFCTYVATAMAASKSASVSVGSENARELDESKSLNTPLDSESINLINEEVVIYPNPTNGSVTVRLTNYYDSRLILTIYDLQGKPMKSIQIEPENTEIHIDLDSVEKGIYLFVLKESINNKIINRKKIVKY